MFSRREMERAQRFLRNRRRGVVMAPMCRGRAAGDPVVYLFRSLFNAVDGTSLDAYTPDLGTGWTEHAGDWEINTNRARTPAVLGGRAFATIDTLLTAYTVETQIILPSGTRDAGLAVRYQNTTNCFVIVAENTRLKMYELPSGAQRADVGGVFASGVGTYVLRAVVTANDITGYVNGVQRFSYASTSLNTHTRAGMTNYRDGSFQVVPFEEFGVY
jgi:hypothetical protein